MQGYFGKQSVAFWTDVASPTKIKGNCWFSSMVSAFSSPIAASFAKQCLYGNNTNDCTWEVRGRAFHSTGNLS